MAFQVVDCDNIRESFGSSGATITLGGAVGTSRPFSAKLSNGDTFWGTARKGAEYSTGLFTYTSGSPGSIAQTTVFVSSNANAAVSFSAGGTGEVFIDPPGRQFDELNLSAITVASAATTDIGAAQSGKVVVSGGVTITSLGTGIHKRRFVHFSGAPLLTHNATSLILPGGANIQAAAGDTAGFLSDSSGNWRCFFYQRASGLAVVAGSMDSISIHGADIASASTINLETATGNLVDVTGTVAITAITLAEGHQRTVRFTGILTLTNGASLVLPSGANITTAAGDYAVFVGYAAGVVRCADYSRASGKAVIGPASTDLTDSAAAVRTTISAAQVAAMASHNAALNPAMDVSQELGTTGATLVNNTAKYILDQWEGFYNHGAATAVVTSAQLAAASFGAVLAGFSFGHQIKATTAITSPANGDFAKHRQKIEGYRVAHWGWGAAGAAAIVVAFQLYSTVSGVALVRLSNSAGDRFYYHEITVAAGWNFYAFTAAGDVSGSWVKDNGIGLNFEVFVSGKETTPGTSFDAWGATAKIQTTNSTNLLGTANNLTVLTGVYIDAGTQLPVAADLPLLIRPFDQELLLCKRYWEHTGKQSGPICSGLIYQSTLAIVLYNYTVAKRAVPSIVVKGSATDYSVYRAGGNNAIDVLPALDASATLISCLFDFQHTTAPFTAGQACAGYNLTGNGDLQFDARL